MCLRGVLEAVITNLYFLFAPHNNEKTAVMQSHPLIVHSRQAPPFVDCTSYTSENGAASLVYLVERNARHPDHIPFYDTVSRCTITAIWHLRSDDTGNEIIVVEYTLVLEPGEDIRFARFERVRLPNENPRRLRKTAPSIQELSQLLETTVRHDSVRISDSWTALVGGDYEVVQKLSAIPAGALDVLDVVALAHELGDAAHQYSVLRHICQWYAATLFKLLCVRAPASAGTYERGPAYTRAGTARVGKVGIRLVDVDSAALLWPASEPTADDVRAVAYDIFSRRGISTGALRSKLRRALENDAALLSTNPLVFASIQATADELVPRVRQSVKECANVAEQTVELARRTQAAEAAADHERDTRLRAEAALAEANARLAELLQKQ